MSIMYYQLNPPPLPLDYRRLDRRAAEEHFAGFVSRIPARITELAQAVNTSSTGETWEPTYLPQSLIALANWFQKHVTARPRTEHEVEQIYASAPEWFRSVAVERWELTDETFSLASDVAMYFGEVLRKADPSIRWELAVGARKDAHYHQPVLRGRSKLRCPPIHLITTYAYGVVSGTRDSKTLLGLHETWLSILQTNDA